MSRSELELTLWVFYLNQTPPPPAPDLTVLHAWTPVAGAPPLTAQPRAGNSPAVGTSSSGFSYSASQLGGKVMRPLPLEGLSLVSTFSPTQDTRG